MAITRRSAALAAVAALAMAGCATPGSTAGDDRAAASRHTYPETPYASTYRPYPGVPTALTGATVYDGAGGRNESGTVLFADCLLYTSDAADE